jgi:hypothetical protein
MKHSGLITAIGLLTLLGAAPAMAQTQSAAGDSGGGGMTGLGSLTGIPTAGDGPDEATVEKRREIEEAYKKVTRSQPTQAAATNDPWANMRGADEAKPAAKPAKTAQKRKPAQ